MQFRCQPKFWVYRGQELVSGSQTRTNAAALKYAANLVGGEELRTELAKPRAAKYVAQQVELYKRVGSGTIPKSFFSKNTLIGEVNSAKTLIELIESD